MILHKKKIHFFQILKKSIHIFLLIELIVGLYATLTQLVKPAITLNYPFEKGQISHYFRGEHALRRYPNGEERCIACKLCEAICPAQAIIIKTELLGFSESRRKTMIYDIDMTKCIYCGLCQEACPVNAIIQTSNFEFAVEKRIQLFYNKEKLLINGSLCENEVILKKLTDFLIH